MNSVFLSTLSVLSLEAAIGAGFLVAIKIFRQPDPDKYKEIGLKLVILILIIAAFLGVSLLGLWGLIPAVLLLAYLGWQELLQGLPQNEEILLPKTLGLLGAFAGLSGLGRTSGEVLLGVMMVTWIAIALPIIVFRRPPALHQTFVTAFAMLVISLPLALLLKLGITTMSAFLFITTIVMLNDGFSEACGRVFGKTPLCPEISPNKTVEGMLGGLAFSLVSAYLLRSLLIDWQTWQILVMTASISFLSLIGDLLFSSLKRAMGIKDFSQVLAVTGGILDKFDGLLFSIPVFYFIVSYHRGL